MMRRSVRSPLTLVALIAFTLLAWSQPEFLRAPQYAVGTQPHGVAIADFNGDGFADLAVANYISNNVSVLLGKGDGAFHSQRVYFAGTAPYSIAAGDFNGDGNLDLAAANYSSNTVSIYIGKGNGTFNSHVDYATATQPISIALADLNRDGKLDVVVAEKDPNTVGVLLGNGDGTLQARVGYATAGEPYSVAVGDFNGDGKLDLATANYLNSTVSVLMGNGDGTFRSHLDYKAGSGPVSVVAADLNADGKLDLVTANYLGSTATVLIGNGDGSFRSPVYYVLGYATGPIAIASGDVNNDGKTDVVIAQEGLFGDYDSAAILLGNGDGTLQQTVNYATGYLARAVAIGDLNSDGNLDFVVANGKETSVNAYIGNGDGTFRGEAEYVGSSGNLAITAGDFNRDGKVDLASTTASPSFGVASILMGSGGGSFLPAVSYLSGGSYAGYSIVTGDFNGDGKPDLATSDYTGNAVSVILGNGDGTFQSSFEYATGVQPDGLAVGDFNSDGHLDLAVADENPDSTGMVSILLGNGDGTFQPHVDYSVGPYAASVAVGDFNGDGNLDLAVANYGLSAGNSITVLIGNGDGTFHGRVDYTVGIGPFKIVPSDFNHDGNLDLAVAYLGGVSMLLGSGDGTFPTLIDTGLSQTFGLATADFNGDGNLDLAAGSYAGVSILLGNGDATFQKAVSYPPSGTSLVALDLNGDDAPDVAVCNAYTDAVRILLNTGGTFIRLTSSPNPSTPGQPVTFIVSVSGSLPGAAIPTGTVTLKDGSSVLTTQTLRQGRMHFVTARLGAGKHTITATYSGDSQFNPHQSSALTQNVQ